jgi:hypothetical protein
MACLPACAHHTAEQLSDRHRGHHAAADCQREAWGSASDLLSCPTPGHQFPLRLGEIVERQAGRIPTDRKRRRGRRRPCNGPDDCLGAWMNVNMLDADNLLGALAALAVQRRK